MFTGWPTDLVWRYKVSNYVEGKSPAAFDVLFWNADTTDGGRAAPRHDHDGPATLLSRRVRQHARHAGGSQSTDHRCLRRRGDRRPLSPWQACYRSARLLGVRTMRFVLSSSGHILRWSTRQGIRGHASSRRRGWPDPAFWAESAEQQNDSWWPDFVSWLGERSDRRTPLTPWAARGWRRLNPLRKLCAGTWHRSPNENVYELFSNNRPTCSAWSGSLGIDWMKVTQQQVNLLPTTGDRQWIHRRRTSGEGAFQGHHCAWLSHAVTNTCGDRTGAGDPRAHGGTEFMD